MTSDLSDARIVAVSVGSSRTMPSSLGPVETGIWKTPVAGRVRVGRMSLDGDVQADLTVHGGEEGAVYAYPEEHYVAWRSELPDRPLPHGWFGENLTIRGITEPQACLGDVLRAGSALLQVTKPRLPCFKLAAKMADPGFPRRFLASGRVGWYFRVLEEGEVAAGDPLVRESADPAGISVAEFLRLAFAEAPDPARVRAVLSVRSLSPAWRARFERLAG